MDKTKAIRDYIEKWESRCYNKGIPDEAPVELEKRGLVPSYRLICLSIMKNDNNLESLGYSRKKCKVYQQIKREEIKLRNG